MAGNALLQASKEAALNKNDITGSLNADEKAAYDEAVRAGVIDVTMAHDLAGKSVIVRHDRALQARRSALVGQFAMAAMAGDEAGKAEAREAVAAFNEKNPTHRIQAMQLAQSVNQRQNRIRKAHEGVYLPSKRRVDAMEAGRFAVPE